MAFHNSDEQYKAQSKERLKKLIVGKHRTTMIGSLDRIESILGFLWGDNKFELNSDFNNNDFDIDVYTLIKEIKDILKNNRELEIRFKLLFQVLRSQILNYGNSNIRDSEKEVDMYEVSWKKYTMKLPVRNPRNG